MSSLREDVLAALAAALTAGGVAVERNRSTPTTIPAEGLAILHDGDPGPPEYTLSPMTWHYRHRAELDVMVAEAPSADATFDDLCAAISVAIAADRTLGGLCDWVEAEAPSPSQIAPEGAPPVKAATVGIVLHYATTDPLG